jgi:hypothetical protein
MRCPVPIVMVLTMGCRQPAECGRPDVSSWEGDPTEFGLTSEVVSTASGFDQVAVAGGIACAIRDDSTTVCWDETGNVTEQGDGYVRLGGHGDAQTICFVTAEGSIDCYPALPDALPGGPVRAIDISISDACVVMMDGSVECAASEAPPEIVAEGISVGTHACATVDGRVTCWGWGGEDIDMDAVASTEVTSLSVPCAATALGKVECWRRESRDYRNLAATCDTRSDIVQVASGGFTCVRDRAGLVQCWGDVGVAGGPSEPLLSMSVGEFHACGVTSDGRLNCWGSDAFEPFIEYFPW